MQFLQVQRSRQLVLILVFNSGLMLDLVILNGANKFSTLESAQLIIFLQRGFILIWIMMMSMQEDKGKQCIQLLLLGLSNG